MTTADERNERIGQGEIEIERRDRGGRRERGAGVSGCAGERVKGSTGERLDMIDYLLI